MKYLFTKFRRDLAKMWVQFFAVFMMAVLAITIYSGMEGVWFGLKGEVDEYYDKTNLADAWVNGSLITDEKMKEIEDLSQVKMVQSSMTLTVNMKTDQDEKPDIKLMALDSDKLFKPLLRSGEKVNYDSKDGIWLDETFCKKRKLKIGDTVELSFGEAKKEFNIEGTILDSEFIYYTGSVTDTVPNHKIHGYAVIGKDAVTDFFGGLKNNELRLKVTKGCNYYKLQKDIEKILGENYYNFSERDDMSSVSQITKEVNQMQNMANLFSAVFIVLAVLSMHSTMTRLVNTQIIQIGTMKAIGLSDGKIRLHYMGYGFFVSLIGCLSGIFFGTRLVSKAVMRVKKATLTIPEWKIALSYRVYLIIAAIVLVCLIATLFAARKGLKHMPAETMRNTTNVKQKKAVGSSGKGIWKNMRYQSKWMIRDNMQNKTRWIMSVIGVAGSMVLMIAGLGFKDSINYSNDYVYNHQYSYDYKIVFNSNYSDDDLKELNDSLEGKKQELYEYNIDLYYSNHKDKERRTISVIDEGDYIGLEKRDGTDVKLNKDTVAISNKIAKVLDVSKGDTIQCRIVGEDKYIDLKISQVLLAPAPQGIFISKEYWEDKLGETFRPTSFLLNSKEDYDKACDLSIVKESTTIEDQLASMKVMTKSVMTIIYLMIVASVLLGCIIIYNLGMLNYIERLRDYATMKVLGFYQKEVRGVIVRDCMITTVIGWLIGIPAGYKFLAFYIGIVQFKTFEWVPSLKPVSFIVATIVVFACSIIVNLIVAHKVTKISMVEALKSVE